MAQPVRVNAAPVLTLWAAVVAERLGHPPDTALSLASAIAGTASRARAGAAGITLLGRQVPVVRLPDGTFRAADDTGAAAPAEPIRAYLARAFGPRLPEVRGAMEERAARHPPEELNRIGLALFATFRPEMPPGAAGRPQRARLHLDRIR